MLCERQVVLREGVGMRLPWVGRIVLSSRGGGREVLRRGMRLKMVSKRQKVPKKKLKKKRCSVALLLLLCLALVALTC